MSTPFYDLASLVVVPSGYKASKVYAQKPLTTDGQLAFTRSTTATRVNSAGLIESVAINVPRLDYLNSTCPKLLLEPSRTNLATYNTAFDDASWTKLNSTVTANAAVSPDGTSNAEQLIDDTTNGAHLTYKILSGRSTGTAWSVFMKKGSLNFGFIGNVQSSTDYTTAVIDLTNGTVKELQNGTGNTGSVTVQNYGDGWYRVIMQSSANGGGTSIGCSDGSALSGATKDSIYTGTGKHIFIYGAQLEDASYATSLIPTTTAAVTRGADACSKTGISSLIGTEFTLFYDGFESIGGNSSRYIVLKGTGSTYVNFISIEAIPGPAIAVNANSASGASVFAATSSAITNGQRVKIALRCKNNSFAFYLNGSLVASQASGTVPVTSDLYLGYYTDYSDNYNLVNQAIIFPTGLTNAQLAELTTI